MDDEKSYWLKREEEKEEKKEADLETEVREQHRKVVEDSLRPFVIEGFFDE